MIGPSLRQQRTNTYASHPHEKAPKDANRHLQLMRTNRPHRLAMMGRYPLLATPKEIPPGPAHQGSGSYPSHTQRKAPPSSDSIGSQRSSWGSTSRLLADMGRRTPDISREAFAETPAQIAHISKMGYVTPHVQGMSGPAHRAIIQPSEATARRASGQPAVSLEPNSRSIGNGDRQGSNTGRETRQERSSGYGQENRKTSFQSNSARQSGWETREPLNGASNDLSSRSLEARLGATTIEWRPTAHDKKLTQTKEDTSGSLQAQDQPGIWPPQQESGQMRSPGPDHWKLWAKVYPQNYEVEELPPTAGPSSSYTASSSQTLQLSEADDQLRSDQESQHEADVPTEYQPGAGLSFDLGLAAPISMGVHLEATSRDAMTADSVTETVNASIDESTDEAAEQLAELKWSIMSEVMPEVHVVENLKEAQRVAKLLMTKYRHLVFACDTEVAFIDIKKQSPCGHGQVICFSVYGGEGVDFGKGPLQGRERKTQLWVNTYFCNPEKDGEEEHKNDMAMAAKGQAILEAFKSFFMSPDIKKVWHNYSFDRHVMANMDIHCRGFAGDTMHMARLLDSSRKGTKNYSLADLTGDKGVMMDLHGESRGKISMKELFAKKNVTKSGQEGKLSKVPPMEELHSSEETRCGWINYSAFDAKATHQLYTSLSQQLQRTACDPDPAIAQALGISRITMMDFYRKFWLPFGELLTDMEKEGMLVNREHLAAAQERAREDQEAAQKSFRDWAKQMVPDAELMNVGSTAQIQQLLFSGLRNNKDTAREELPPERMFKALNTKGIILEGAKKPKKNIDITLWGLWGRGKDSRLNPDVYTTKGWPAVSTPVLRTLAGKPGLAKKALSQLMDASLESDSEPSLSDVASFAEEDSEDADDGQIWALDNSQIVADKMKRLGHLIEDAPTTDKLQKEADDRGYGKLYAAFDGGVAGLEACTAVDSLCEVGAIDTLLSNFIEPLQQDDIATRNPDGSLGRVHCSLNINTETGRLSARRPNLQNQPALEKDRYKVRKAFTADTGNHLVVADYGQLELRLLAHMTNCKSMLTAFKAGGDFHSRTALGMYDHIKEAIAKERCLLEWDGPPGSKSPVPLLKDMFSSERRKAKILNFSIAYGKTAHGLSKDWNVELNEAQNTVDRWYGDRPEVLEWQRMQRANAEQLGYVTTMLGRRRYLPDAMGSNGKAKGHALRAAINTPIQGSAADVATAAMISIARCPQLRDLGWKLLLQVHDEVILEGPEESADQAKALVVGHMERPFNGKNPLLVALNVDANTAATWYEAK